MNAEDTFRAAEWLVVKITLLVLLVVGAAKIVVPEIAELVKLLR